MTHDHDAEPGSKITEPARERMRRRTAKQQLNDTLRELREPDDDVPDADDSSAWVGVMR